MELDNTDLAILAELERNGRSTHAEIGRTLGMSGQGVYARINRMEESGVIQGYSVQIDPKVRLGSVVAFVRVTTRAQADEHDLFESLALKDERIMECHDVAGEDSYLLKVRCKTLEELRELLSTVRSVPQVTRTLASVVLTAIKETGMKVGR